MLGRAMALNFTITAKVTTASTSGFQRLYHATLVSHVGSIVRFGVNYEKLREAGGRDFWAADQPEGAWQFGDLAAQQLLFQGGDPKQAMLSFELALPLLESFQAQEPDPWLVVYPQGYKFTPACFPTLTAQMKNVEITFEE